MPDGAAARGRGAEPPAAPRGRGPCGIAAGRACCRRPCGAGACRADRRAGPARLIDAVKEAVEANRIDLYLQPIVTLPQRKVRYYEAVTRLRDDNDKVLDRGRFHRARRKRRADRQDRPHA